MRAGLELRPLRRKGSSSACSRSRLITEPRSPFLFTCQTAHVSSFPRRVFAPGFCFLCFAHPNEGWRSAEKTLGCSGTRGACLNAARQTPCEASCVSRETLASRRSTVAILGSGPALPSPAALLSLRFGEQPDRSQRAPRVRVVVPGGRGPGASRSDGCEPAPRDATPRSIFGIASRRRPS